MLFRADKIDLKSLDDELEKHLTRILSRHIDAKRPKEEWEIDLAKLNLQHVVANGIYMALSIRALMMAKMLQDGGASTASLRASFQQEVTIWQKFDLPNITKLRLIYTYDYVLMLQMSYTGRFKIPFNGPDNISLSLFICLVI
ncbi:hypothetical protein Ahy_B08g089862 [Arachis hypogaea]|uniref:Uncharacterized protein n=1 Tax=Arachis hypogaea TaxID=3818 RepID=A0A444XYZ4_ARAHY|nr:hypothetical protein Ahy_B08g089862 [Arachis hypogaea]